MLMPMPTYTTLMRPSSGKKVIAPRHDTRAPRKAVVQLLLRGVDHGGSHRKLPPSTDTKEGALTLVDRSVSEPLPTAKQPCVPRLDDESSQG